eukprot:CAMPEP_0171235262 /NCGR_PEP_ID=MMETSP0790-20130122/41855_1 /TAXON_ID=2925 /ORGANISM="Alexandrium catenella, Strain OF101" /LENGTH=71 /DNA_ID=CAMNT_0011701567 /DNA_START=146 /DNA_END=361 /DNA_ORIENTATION=+
MRAELGLLAFCKLPDAMTKACTSGYDCRRLFAALSSIMFSMTKFSTSLLRPMALMPKALTWASAPTAPVVP